MAFHPTFAAILLLTSVFLGHTTTAFTVYPRLTALSSIFLSKSNDNNSNNNAPLKSRLAGNTRPPTVEELQIMDTMIDKLADAKPYDLPTAVQRAYRVISSPQFFLRIAARQDMATSEQEQSKLQALACNLVSTLEAVVSTTSDKLDERAQQLEVIVKAAAEPDSGEFLVPLTVERIAAVRQQLSQLDQSELDDTFLTTLDSWMNKSHKDGMDLMVQVLQKVLQAYAGTVVLYQLQQRSSVAQEKQHDTPTLLHELLQTDADYWDEALQRHDTADLTRLQARVQTTMETIVLGLDAGSMQQKVLAEYLQEMNKRIEAINKIKQ
jgi:hypothetical protein